MKFPIATALACGLAGLTAAAALAQPAAAPAPQSTAAPKAPTPRPTPTPATGEVTKIPANLAPARIQSAALTVADLPGEQKWYETVLGMVKVRDVGANEIVLSMEPNNPNAANVVLQRGTRQPGATSYGRLILNVKNARDTAAFLQTHGVTTRAVIPNQASFFADPEGNQIEIDQPDSVAPAAAPAR